MTKRRDWRHPIENSTNSGHCYISRDRKKPLIYLETALRNPQIERLEASKGRKSLFAFNFFVRGEPRPFLIVARYKF